MDDINKNEFRLLTYEQAKELELFNKIGIECAPTDYAILSNNSTSERYHINGDDSRKGRAGSWLLEPNNGITIVDYDGKYNSVNNYSRRCGIRPILHYPITNLATKVVKRNPIFEIEYGEYPQYVVDEKTSKILDYKYETGKLKETGKTYTKDKNVDDSEYCSFLPTEQIEYEYNNKKYVKVKKAASREITLSNGIALDSRQEYFWLEVSPISWYVDTKAKLLISKNIIASGIRAIDVNGHNDNFKKTEIYKFLNEYFAKDIIPSKINEINLNSEELSESIPTKNEIINNPYELDFNKITEEEIIKEAINNNIPVFIHGNNNDGKLSRVKQLDPNCIIVYLPTATVESLNGTNNFFQKYGEMVNIPPTWYTKMKEKCENEPDKLHIIVFDKLTNTNLEIQNIVNKIMFDNEENGTWKLPYNARIVATGNNTEKLPEELFNRFAHVYLEATTENWLKWARAYKKNNIKLEYKEIEEKIIHPYIYAYISYKSKSDKNILRKEYNGTKPTADPKKWEIASKVLYETKKPEMLRALIGEDLTKDFISFCQQKVITINDVIKNNYTEEELAELNDASKYLTTLLLAQVDANKLVKARAFITKLGKEFELIFDDYWSSDDESKREELVEIESIEQNQYIK